MDNIQDTIYEVNTQIERLLEEVQKMTYEKNYYFTDNGELRHPEDEMILDELYKIIDVCSEVIDDLKHTKDKLSDLSSS